ncbi:MAG: CRISPR-associated protein Cas4 [Nanoarchaeota archaeon]|nr:CRISPR-associated protein Cas4 [Nanoarchaeota archaeon]MBU1444936.1 CRISPR-associated protein Cas4 [Nanoarchaeota archaeon]MBU2420132.1 CRISPR-associated protein Cas4 [Nanoarchaeota archaeon]MBU2475691.1 CRISPR-associated protein Cas4 [Nanoarchaeota archaeon]
MNKIAVSKLSEYLYCKRKLYLQEVLGFVPELKREVVKGSIRHNVFDDVNKLDESIVKSFKRFVPFSDVFMSYRSAYYKSFFGFVQRNKEDLLKVGIKPMEFFHEKWPAFLFEARERANKVHNLMGKEKVFGDQLWERLFPKYMTEIWVESDFLKLKGVIDRIEIFEDRAVPIELKTGKMPHEGVWPGHRIQLEAYMLLINEGLGKNVKEGYIEYLDSKERRGVVMNPFVREEIVGLVNDVFAMLESDKVPEKVKNENKCKSCALREKCYNL